MLRLACLLSLVAFSVVLSTAVARAEDTAPENLHVRGLADIPGVVRWLGEEAERIDAVQVLVAFDAMTFSPPPGPHEWRSHEDLAPHLPLWLDGLGLWDQTSERDIRATSSLNPRSVRVGDERWRERLQALVERTWWQGDRIWRLEPVLRWTKRLLQRTDCELQGTTDRAPRMLVLVTGRLTPERWVETTSMGEVADWRRKLAPLGTYLDCEAVGSMLDRRGCRLYVVSPEAFFGDHETLKELPSLPWASRPRLLPAELVDGTDVLGIQAGGFVQIRALPRGPARDALDAWVRERLGGAAVLVDLRSPRPPDPVLFPSHSSRSRFVGALPRYFPWAAGQLLADDHTPSGYGWWPWVRAAAETGGRFVVYPRLERPLVDACPRDEALLLDLQPEYVHAAHRAKLRAGDPALDLISDAAAGLVKVTPWSDRFNGGRQASGWSAYARTRPLRLTNDWLARSLPWGIEFDRGDMRPAALARRLRDETIPRYEEALERIAAGIAAADSGEDAYSPPRSIANLRKFRLDLATSIFHLEAWALALDEAALDPARGRRPVRRGSNLTLLPAIRLSDCLEAYDGREVTPEEEILHAGWRPADARGYQGNLLGVPPTDLLFRARREHANVLRRLDVRLRPDALRVIQAAEDVMKHLARSPWGWGVYHAEIYTFRLGP